MESTLRQYKSPRKQSPSFLTVTLRYVTVREYDSQWSVKCKQSPVYGVFWPLLPHPSTGRNETRTWSSLPLETFPFNFVYKSVQNLFSYRGHRHTHTHTHTHKPTPVKTYSLAFAGNEKHNYRRMTERRVMSAKILSTAAQLYETNHIQLQRLAMGKRPWMSGVIW